MMIFNTSSHYKKVVAITMCLVAVIATVISLGLPDLEHDDTQYSFHSYVGWNGYIDIVNIAEIFNGGNYGQRVQLELYGQDGKLVQTMSFEIDPGEQRDVILNDLEGFKIDSYGFLLLRSSTEDVGGRLSYYRSSTANDQFDFVFSAPLRRSFKGTSHVGFNTFDPSEGSRMVSNWLTIINLENRISEFTIYKQNRLGTILDKIKIKLPPYSRYDVEGGHENPGPNNYGLVTIIPTDSETYYLANLTRYGMKPDLSGFDFAFQLQARAGQKTLSAPIKSRLTRYNPVKNWVEIVNVSAQYPEGKIDFYDPDGNLIETIMHNFTPYAQLHIDASAILGTHNTGMVTITTTRGDAPLIAQSMFYLREGGTKEIADLYGAPGIDPDQIQEVSALSWNRFLGMENYFTIANPFPTDRYFEVSINTSDGTSTPLEVYLPAFGNKQLSLHNLEATDPDSYGGVYIYGEVLADVVRIKKIDGVYNKIDFANYTTAHNSSYTGGGYDPDAGNENSEEYDATLGSKVSEIRLTTQDVLNLQKAADTYAISKATNTVFIQGFSSVLGTSTYLKPLEIRSPKYEQSVDLQNISSQNQPYVRTTFFESNLSGTDFIRVTLIETKSNIKISGVMTHKGILYSMRPHIMDPSGQTIAVSEISSDFLDDAPGCGVEEAPEVNPYQTKPQIAKISETLRNRENQDLTIEVATEADYSRVSHHGSAAAANADILSIFNEVDAIYQNHFNVRVKVVFQNAWESRDPYSNIPTTPDGLSEFRSYWQEHFAPTTSFDYAHIFSNRYDPAALGRAYLGTTCSSYAYGSSRTRQGVTLNGNEFRTVAHELGHSLSAIHDSCSRNDDFIMCVIGSRLKSVFSPQSIQSINEYIDSQQCLSFEGSAPVFRSFPPQQVTAGDLLSFTLDATDRDGDNLTFYIKDKLQGMRIDGNTVLWVPDDNQTGFHTFTFMVEDEKGATDDVRGSIRVMERKNTSSPPWQNPHDRIDANIDGVRTARDALVIINRLERGSTTLVGTPNIAAGDYYYDVNGDGSVTPNDALIIINALSDN